MEVVSLVLSVIALFLVGAVGYLIWRQQLSARGTGPTEKHPHDEDKPHLSCEFEKSDEAHRLTLRLESPRPLTACQVRVLDGPVTFTDGQDGVTSADLTRADYGAIEPGPPATRRVRISDAVTGNGHPHAPHEPDAGHGNGHAADNGHARIMLDCTSGSESWTAVHTVALPPGRSRIRFI
jgi:ABC-type nickel/cobalt efflux system permease component RcnA